MIFRSFNPLTYFLVYLGVVRVHVSVCEYSPFGARMVRFSVNIVLRGANMVFHYCILIPNLSLFFSQTPEI